MMNNADDMVVVGDPRQQAYRTGWKTKYKNLHDIFEFFERNASYDLDTTMLSVAHRCSADVMRYTNLLYLGYQLVRPSDERLVKLKGKVAVLEKKDFAAWVAARTEKPTALTWNNKVANALGNDRSHSSWHALCLLEHAGNAGMVGEKCLAFIDGEYVS